MMTTEQYTQGHRGDPDQLFPEREHIPKRNNAFQVSAAQLHTTGETGCGLLSCRRTDSPVCGQTLLGTARGWYRENPVSYNSSSGSGGCLAYD